VTFVPDAVAAMPRYRFQGRKAIAEILHLNDEIRELIIARQPVRLLRELPGATALASCAKVRWRWCSGRTTLQEINRVTFVA